MPLDDLRAALVDLSAAVEPASGDALATVRRIGAGRRRARTIAISSVAVVTVAAAVSGIVALGHPTRSDRIGTTSPPASPTTAAPRLCSVADLTHHGLAPMPHPERVHAVALSDVAELEPPGRAVEPDVRAAAVWARARIPLTPRTSYRLLLAVYTAPYPSPASGPAVGRRLAWVIVRDNFAIDQRAISIPSLGTARTVRPPCSFGTRLDVYDASTGRHLASSASRA